MMSQFACRVRLRALVRDSSPLQRPSRRIEAHSSVSCGRHLHDYTSIPRLNARRFVQFGCAFSKTHCKDSLSREARRYIHLRRIYDSAIGPDKSIYISRNHDQTKGKVCTARVFRLYAHTRTDRSEPVSGMDDRATIKHRQAAKRIELIKKKLLDERGSHNPEVKHNINVRFTESLTQAIEEVQTRTDDINLNTQLRDTAPINTPRPVTSSILNLKAYTEKQHVDLHAKSDSHMPRKFGTKMPTTALRIIHERLNGDEVSQRSTGREGKDSVSVNNAERPRLENLGQQVSQTDTTNELTAADVLLHHRMRSNSTPYRIRNKAQQLRRDRTAGMTNSDIINGSQIPVTGDSKAGAEVEHAVMFGQRGSETKDTQESYSVYARRVPHKPPEIRRYITEIKACAPSGKWMTAQRLLNEMRAYDMDIPRHTYNTMLECCEAFVSDQNTISSVIADVPVSAAKDLDTRSQLFSDTLSRLLEGASRKDTEISERCQKPLGSTGLDDKAETHVRIYPTLMENPGTVATSKYALSILRYMRKNSLTVDTARYAYAAQIFANMGVWNDMRWLCTDMRSKGYTLDRAVYEHVFRTCTKKVASGKFVDVLGEMHKDGFSFTSTSYDRAVRTLTHEDTLSVALALLQNSHKYGASILADTYKDLIEACGWYGQGEIALHVVGCLRRDGETLFNTRAHRYQYLQDSYYRILQASVIAGKPSTVTRLVHEMQQGGYLRHSTSPELHSVYDWLFDSLLVKEQRNSSSDTLCAMAEGGMSDQLLVAYSNDRRQESLLEVLRVLQNASTRPTLTAYGSVLSSLGNQGDHEYVLQTIQKLDKHRDAWRARSAEKDSVYTNLFSRAIHASRNRDGQGWQTSYLLLSAAHQRGCYDPELYAALMDTHSSAGEWQLAIRLLYLFKIHPEGFVPKPDLYISAIQACQPDGKLRAAYDVVREMRARDCLSPKSDDVARALADVALECNDWNDFARSLWDTKKACEGGTFMSQFLSSRNIMGKYKWLIDLSRIAPRTQMVTLSELSTGQKVLETCWSHNKWLMLRSVVRSMQSEGGIGEEHIGVLWLVYHFRGKNHKAAVDVLRDMQERHAIRTQTSTHPPALTPAQIVEQDGAIRHAMLYVCARIANWTMYQQMQKDNRRKNVDVQLSNGEFENLVAEARDRKLTSSKQLFYTANLIKHTRPGGLSAIRQNNREVASFYAADGKAERAAHLLSEWGQKKARENKVMHRSADVIRYTYNSIITACVAHFKPFRALDLLMDMDKLDINADSDIYSRVVVAMVNSRRHEIARSMILRDVDRSFPYLVRCALEPSRTERNGRRNNRTPVVQIDGLWEGLMKTKDVVSGGSKTALEYVLATADKFLMSRNMSHANSISALHLYKSQKSMHRCLQLLRYMEAQQYPISCLVYDPIIAGLTSSGEVDSARALFEEMDEKGIAKATSTYDAMISGYGGRDALQLLRECEESNLPTDTKLYNNVINACIQDGDTGTAFQLIFEMPNKGLRPDIHTYMGALSTCKLHGEIYMARDLFYDMENRGIRADTRIYNAAIATCTKNGQWQEAAELLGEMKRAGIVPNAVTYTIAISSCQLHGMVDEAVEWLTEMKACGYTPVPWAYDHIIAACAVSGRVVVAEEMRKEREALLYDIARTHN